MAVGRIRVTPEQMRATAQRARGEVQNWNMEVTNIAVLVAEMDSLWDGLGNNSFNQKFQSERPLFDRLIQLMTEYITCIDQAAALYDRTEQEVSNIVRRR